jgi:hypothetical protein
MHTHHKAKLPKAEVSARRHADCERRMNMPSPQPARLQQKDSKLNHDDLDLNDHFYEKAIFRRVRILTLRFLP